MTLSPIMTASSALRGPARSALSGAAALRISPSGAGRSRLFHATPRPLVKAGDAIPSVNGLMEGSPGNKVDLAKELSSGKGVIVGVPAAFSMYFIHYACALLLSLSLSLSVSILYI